MMQHARTPWIWMSHSNSQASLLLCLWRCWQWTLPYLVQKPKPLLWGWCMAHTKRLWRLVWPLAILLCMKWNICQQLFQVEQELMVHGCSSGLGWREGPKPLIHKKKKLGPLRHLTVDNGQMVEHHNFPAIQKHLPGMCTVKIDSSTHYVWEG